MTTLNFHVADWAAWAPGLCHKAAWRAWDGGHLPLDDHSAPEIRFVNALLRRRLGRLSRMALQVAAEAAGESTPVHTVFASRHGELSRTVSLLHDLASDTPPSPASFSLSVHNTAIGIFSIARSDTSASTAIAAGEETFLWALQEAVLRLAADPSLPVLLVYADEALPNEYQAFADSAELTWAMALLLTPGNTSQLEWGENAVTERSNGPLPLAFLAWWLRRADALRWHGDRLAILGYRHD